MQLPDPVSIMQGFVDAVNRHEMAEVLEMFDEDATLRAEPPLPGSPKPEYSGRGEIDKWLGALMAEHLSIVASNFQASGNQVTFDARMSADRFAEAGVDPVHAHVRAMLDQSFIDAITFGLSPESVEKLRAAAAAQPS